MSHLNSLPYLFYGFGRRVNEASGNMESTKYWMYPKVSNTSNYLNHTVVLNETISKSPVNLFLYNSDKFVDFGVRVTDLKCYQSLVRYFGTLNETDHSLVESEMSLNTTTVSLVGEIAVFETTMEKRRGKCLFKFNFDFLKL